MSKKTILYALGMLFLCILAVTTAGASVMAMSAPLNGAGIGEGGSGSMSTTDVAGIQGGNTDVAEDGFYIKAVDEYVAKVREFDTPVLTIMQYAKSARTVDDKRSMVIEYYDTGERTFIATTNAAFAAQTAGNTAYLPVSDIEAFTEDDTILVQGVKGYKEDGTTKDHRDLMLIYTGNKNDSNNTIEVYAVNGMKNTSGAADKYKNFRLPEIPNGTSLLRMSKACSHIKSQTGRFMSYPTPKEQFMQISKAQFEIASIDKLRDKVVKWGESELLEDAIYDYKIAKEYRTLFGVKSVTKHPTNEGIEVYTSEGWWHQAGTFANIGHLDENNEPVISEDDMVDLTEAVFHYGGNRKILLASRGLLAALMKIKSDKYVWKQDVEAFGLNFKMWSDGFGEILVIRYDIFTKAGMDGYGFILDPEFISERTLFPFGQNMIDLGKAGVRETQAHVFKEISCSYLRNSKAHARLQLVQRA